MVIAMERPWMLLLLPVLVVLIVWMAKRLRMQDKKKKNKYIAFRVLVSLLLVLTLTGFSLDKKQDTTTTIFLVDVSDSMSGNLASVETYLGNVITEMPGKNSFGIVAFGGDAQVEQFVTDKQIFTGLTTDTVKTATNMENAVSAAMALYPDNTAKRLVVISDGLENEGSVLNMATTLQAQNVELDVVKLDSVVGDEVYVDDLTIPESIRVGDQYAVTVNVISNVSTSATVSLYCGRTLKGQERVQLSVGENQFMFYDVADETGFRSYRVSIQPDTDTISVNNEYSAYAQIESKDRILVIQGQAGEGDGFAKVLEAAGCYFDMVTPTGAPKTLNDMLNYKSIVLLDVYYDDLKEGFVNNIESYVKDYAGGLVAIGGEDSFALGGWRETVLEQILPVNMDLDGERQIPKMEMIMVIDHSGSMTDSAQDGMGGTAMDLAKAAAVSGLDNLRKTDNIGVLAFDDTFTWVIEPQKAEDKEALENKILGIQIGGGTSIYPALVEAKNRLSQSDAQIKHIILLTDGQDGFRSQYDSLCKEIVEQGITLSSVAVGTGADTNMMEGLAKACNGRYYYTDINQGIPRIFAKEVFLSAKEYLVQEEFMPVIASSHDMISALADGAPSLKGYVASSAKPTAQQVLVTHKDDPLLTTWQYGLGKTVAWNSDATGEWTGNWASWDGYVQFWKNVIDSTITDTSVGDDKLEIVQSGSSATISYTTDTYDKDTVVTAICTDEEGNQKEVELQPVTPGSYEAKISMDQVGVYNIALVNKKGNQVVKNMNSATAMQYSAEYRFYENTDSLENLVALCGGKFLDMEEEVFLPINSKVKAKTNISNWLLLFALFIFMLDVIERRLNLAPVAYVMDKLGVKTKLASIKSRASRKAKKSDSIEGSVKQMADVGVTEAVPSNVNSSVTDASPSAGNETLVKKAEKPKREKKQKAKKQVEEVRKLDTAALLKKQKDREQF